MQLGAQLPSLGSHTSKRPIAFKCIPGLVSSLLLIKCLMPIALLQNTENTALLGHGRRPEQSSSRTLRP